MISAEELQAVCGIRHDRIVAIYPHLVTAMQTYGVDTPLRVAMFIAQTAHETGSYKWLEELASGEAYEGRADLGNTHPGDGKTYKGRGVIQLTGRTNYGKFSQEMFDTPTVLLDAPWMVAELELAAMAAGWYWKWKNLNVPSDARDILTATKKINGGTNGIVERQKLYARALYVLGLK